MAGYREQRPCPPVGDRRLHLDQRLSGKERREVDRDRLDGPPQWRIAPVCRHHVPGGQAGLDLRHLCVIEVDDRQSRWGPHPGLPYEQ
ncbi:hypothetical protein O7626_14495 [Micromonospora sp. WMMD1102]|uniref:hypothetical protein n=1 Tax=Micromonospora sp. WMMD1102 TaxID=3016105 RepID=UPI002414F89C|nr:hypothetical protein [Micromonospora sp. WMMD1102]MDG4787124.1 hypothetical protein [Micromonospora sp. WMMD1102]